MAHFAQLNLETNIVQQVLVVDNADCVNPATGLEEEATGVQFLQQIFGGYYKQTSYNSTFRKNYAGIGDVYDTVRDAFISTKPFNSWVLDESVCRWQAPIAYPEDGLHYKWDEASLHWVRTVLEEG